MCVGPTLAPLYEFIQGSFRAKGKIPFAPEA